MVSVKIAIDYIQWMLINVLLRYLTNSSGTWTCDISWEEYEIVYVDKELEDYETTYTDKEWKNVSFCLYFYLTRTSETDYFKAYIVILLGQILKWSYSSTLTFRCFWSEMWRCNFRQSHMVSITWSISNRECQQRSSVQEQFHFEWGV